MKITFPSFELSLAEDLPPPGLDARALSLWYDAKGDWQQAHSFIQDEEGKDAARIHGYLHRKEGDASNARYWYSRAGCRFPDESLSAEWKNLVLQVLG
jgi:hypothetical protein